MAGVQCRTEYTIQLMAPGGPNHAVDADDCLVTAWCC